MAEGSGAAGEVVVLSLVMNSTIAYNCQYYQWAISAIAVQPADLDVAVKPLTEEYLAAEVLVYLLLLLFFLQSQQ